MKHSIVLAPMVLAIALGARPAAAQEVVFAYKFEPNAVERHRVKLNQEATMGAMSVTNLVDMEVTIKCVTANDGKYGMELKFDKCDVTQQMMGNTTETPLGEQITGQTIVFTTDASGEVTNIEPLGAMDAWPVAQQVIRPVLESWYPHLPNKAIAVGGTWKKAGVKQTDESGTETLTNATFTYKGLKKEKTREVAVVEQVLDTTLGGSSSNALGSYILAGTGKGKGEFWFDAVKSRVVKFKTDIDVTLDMTPQSGGDTMKTLLVNHVERSILE